MDNHVFLRGRRNDWILPKLLVCGEWRDAEGPFWKPSPGVPMLYGFRGTSSLWLDTVAVTTLRTSSSELIYLLRSSILAEHSVKRGLRKTILTKGPSTDYVWFLKSFFTFSLVFSSSGF